MPVTGLTPNIRLVQPEPEELDGLPVEVKVEDPEDDGSNDKKKIDAKGNVVEIEHADGSITISLDGSSVEADPDQDDNPPGWFANLATKIDPQQLGQISESLLRGIGDDITSRTDWIEQRTEGLRMLGLRIETQEAGDSADGAAVEGMSRVRHPLMLEAVLRFQANARSEFLPTDGPVKIRDDDNNPTNDEDALADAFEKDLNRFLTVTDKNYYPDTDRMLLKLGFGGLAYKKVYFSPLYNRPVSEYVDADDLIVNNNATSLATAKRVTHRIMMTPSIMRRMQLLDVYRDIELTTPNDPQADALKQEEKEQQGISTTVANPDDRDREVYECYCELDIKGFEHKWKGKVSGLEVPYRVTIDLSSREILAVVRDYDQDSEMLPERRDTFVDYIFVPGFGYYPIGLLHILGNTTNAVTAAWRIMLDNGMFANFPGGLVAKDAGRQNSNIQRVPPGSFIPIETNGQPIGQVVSPLPYSSQGMPALMQLTDNMVQQGQRVGSTSEQPTGEGKADAPVGTTLALIEQAQKILNAVHKRMHAAQARELQLIAKCFKENPESFWQQNRKPARQWDEETFRKALDNSNLVPQADPNTASHIQRLMKVQALGLIAKEAPPGMFDAIKIAKTMVRAIGYSDPEQYMAPPEAMGRPTPEQEKDKAEIAIKQALAEVEKMKAQTTMQQAQVGVQKTQAEIQNMQATQGLGAAKLELDKANSDIKNKVDIVKTQMDAALKNRQIDASTEKDLMSERIQLVDVAQNLAVHPESAPLVAPLVQPAWENVKAREAELKTRKGLKPDLPEEPTNG
jgi:hypothetical protein